MWKAEGRREHDWGIGSSILSILYNANRGEKQPALEPNDLNPMVRKKPKPKQTPRQKIFAIGDQLGIPRPEAK